MVKGKNVVCPQCGKRFNSAFALQQHKSTVHASSAPVRRVAQRRAVRPKRANSSLAIQALTGNDRLGYWEIPAGKGQGDLFTVIPIAPSSLEDSRLQAHGSLWARWRPKALKARISIAGASTTFGSVVLGWSPEADFIKGDAAKSVNRILALKPSKEVRAWETVEMVIPTTTDRKWYHTAGLPAESSHGSLVFAMDSPFGGYTGKVGMTIQLIWTVEFEGIELDQATGGGEDHILRPDAGWANLFTTSDGSWDAGRLTMKEHSGGSMAAFSAAKPNYIYEPAEGTKVPYVNEAGSNIQASYFVRIQGYSTPGLALAATAKDAKDYIVTGDTSKLIKYTNACSLFVTPAIPVFKGKPAGSYSLVHDRQHEVEIEKLQQRIVELELELAGNETSGGPHIRH